MQGARRAHRPVGEPVHLGELQPAGADPRDHHATTGRAQVDGREGLFAHRSTPDSFRPNDLGQFSFHGIDGGSYVIELVSDGGKILAVGHTFTVAPGETVATFVRLALKAPWFHGFFGNAASAVASIAASTGVTAMAPEQMACASPPCSQ